MIKQAEFRTFQRLPSEGEGWILLLKDLQVNEGRGGGGFVPTMRLVTLTLFSPARLTLSSFTTCTWHWLLCSSISSWMAFQYVDENLH